MEITLTPDVDIVFKLEFTNAQKKELDIKKSEDVNGLYIYNYGSILINVNSEDFKLLKEDGIVDLFTKVATHETLHHTIYGVTNGYANGFEDRVVLFMADQADCLK